MDIKIIHNQSQNRFESHIEGLIARIDYIIEDSNMSITHTKVPKELEGRGIAAQLTKQVLEYARINGFKVYPICPYAQVYIQRHPEYSDLLPK